MTIEVLDSGLHKEVSVILQELFLTNDTNDQQGSMMVNHIISLWSGGEIEILGKRDETNQIIGIVVLSLGSNRLSFVHISIQGSGLDQEQVELFERELFDTGFNRLKTYESWVTSGGSSWLSKNLIEHALTVGFKQYDQIGMVANRDVLKNLKVPPLPEGYSLETYDVKWNSMVAQLFYEGLKDSPERNAEPDTLATIERCENIVLGTVNGQWGDFKEGRYSWILKSNDEIVGVSLYTVMNDTSGFGVGLCLDPAHRGKGLGRLMFTHSLKSILDSEPNVKEMTHATSSTNSALSLYESVGFQEISRHSLFSWVNDES